MSEEINASGSAVKGVPFPKTPTGMPGPGPKSSQPIKVSPEELLRMLGYKIVPPESVAGQTIPPAASASASSASSVKSSKPAKPIDTAKLKGTLTKIKLLTQITTAAIGTALIVIELSDYTNAFKTMARR